MPYSRYQIRIYDAIEDAHKVVERSVREAQGYHHYGTFSYKGETMRLVMGMGGIPHDHCFTSEDYPPRRPKTPTGKQWRKENPDAA